MIANLFFLILIGLTSALNTPVLIIDDGVLDNVIETTINPFSKTMASEFEKISILLQESCANIIFFIEDTFSAEDISIRDYKGTAFVHLQKSFLEKKVKYLPKVVKPYDYLKERFESYKYNTFRLRSTTTKLRLDENFKILYIYFDDGDIESRAETLRRHDVIIKEVYFAVKQLATGPVAAFYTGKRNAVELKSAPHQAIPFQAAVRSEGSADIPWYTVECTNAVFKFHDPKLLNGDAAIMVPQSTCHYSEPKTKTNNIAFVYEIDLEAHNKGQKEKLYRLKFCFDFQENRRAGWKLTEVVFLKANYDIMDKNFYSMEYPWAEFFESNAPLILEPKEWHEPKLNIRSYQIWLKPPGNIKMLPKTPKTSTTAKYTGRIHINMHTFPPNKWPQVFFKTFAGLGSWKMENEEDRDVLTSLPIMSGFFIVFVLLAILFWGIYMLMNCNTNDRYDSVDSKPLVQATAE